MNYSLIIPVYNEERTLPQLINILNNLNNENLEVIIIDDGSNDNTKEILLKNNQFIIKGLNFIPNAPIALCITPLDQIPL